MKKKPYINNAYYFWLIVILNIPITTFGQSIAEQLGAISTNFIVKSDSILLNNKNQILIKRGVYNYRSDNVGYGYGYGFQSYHIEFISKNKIKTKKRQRKGIFNSYNYYELRLVDKFGAEYNIVQLRNTDVNFISGTYKKDTTFKYSINLNRIPLIDFENISEINVIKIVK